MSASGALAHPPTNFSGLALTLGSVGLYILAILVMNPDFFYRDDYQSQFMPVFQEIGQALRLGDWLWISERSWNQGNYIGEYQFGIFNPVSMLLIAGLPSFENAANAAAYFSAAHLFLAGAGGYWLGRELNVSSHWSAVLGFTLATNLLVLYWFASSWIPALVSYTWFIFAVAALLRVHNGRSGVLLATAFSYLTLVSGWPPTVMAYGVMGLALFASSSYRYLAGDGDAAPLLALTVAGGAAVLASLPAIYPMIVHHDHSSRASALKNTGQLVASLNGLVFSFNPGYTPFMKLFQNYRPLAVPMYYCAWFVVLAFAMPDFWKRLPRASAGLAVLATCGIVFFALSMAPTQVGSLRWPFRFIPYFHVCLVALAVVQLARGSSGLSRLTLAALLLFSTYLAAVATLSKAALAGSGLMLLAVGVAFFARSKPALPILVLALSLGLQIATQYLYPDNSIPDFKVPLEVETVRATVDSLATDDGNTLYLYAKADHRSLGGDAIIGNMPLWGNGVRTINGYSPVPLRGLANFMCFSHISGSCPKAIDRLTAAEPRTGQSYLELMGITRIVAQRGPHAKRFDRLKPDGWKELRRLNNKRVRVFQRPPPAAARPYGVAWHDPTVSISAQETGQRFVHRFVVDNTLGAATPLVFARAWYPGFEASFNDSPVAVTALEDMILSVELPAGASGKLVLSYRPPLWRLTTLIALLAILAALIGGRIHGRMLAK